MLLLSLHSGKDLTLRRRHFQYPGRRAPSPHLSSHQNLEMEITSLLASLYQGKSGKYLGSRIIGTVVAGTKTAGTAVTKMEQMRVMYD
jgi:hypothetical protein